jgi:hypothetical protein
MKQPIDRIEQRVRHQRVVLAQMDRDHVEIDAEEIADQQIGERQIQHGVGEERLDRVRARQQPVVCM